MCSGAFLEGYTLGVSPQSLSRRKPIKPCLALANTKIFHHTFVQTETLNSIAKKQASSNERH